MMVMGYLALTIIPFHCQWLKPNQVWAISFYDNIESIILLNLICEWHMHTDGASILDGPKYFSFLCWTLWSFFDLIRQFLEPKNVVFAVKPWTKHSSYFFFHENENLWLIKILLCILISGETENKIKESRSCRTGRKNVSPGPSKIEFFPLKI